MSNLLNFVKEEGISSLFLLLSLEPQNVNGGLFTRVTMTSMTGAWYYRLTPFELIFFQLLLFKILLFRYFLVLPIDLSNLIKEQNVLGRRRRRKREDYESRAKKELLGNTILSSLRRLDEQDCFLRTLCELQWNYSNGYKIPNSVESIILGLKKSGTKRKKMEIPNNRTIIDKPIVSVFEEAVEIGNFGFAINNNSTCQLQYSLCPLTSEEIVSYVHDMSLDELINTS